MIRTILYRDLSPLIICRCEGLNVLFNILERQSDLLEDWRSDYLEDSLNMSSPFALQRSNVAYEQLLKHCHNEFQKTYWKWFVALSEIPRPSYHCGPFSEWVMKQADKLGLRAKTDKAKNVCVHIPASKGHENAPGVILQAHMDMVASVVDGKEFNFETTPITLIVNDTHITADGTTLGADDGAGLASLLSLMELRDQFEHGPIEALFTTDEEPGLLGAMELKEGELFDSAKYFINVDSEEWGEVCISSAGCAQRNITVPFTRELATGDLVTVSLEGFKGGHTGAEIHTQRANALKWMVRMVLHQNPLKQSIRLVDFKAGHTDNAIPTKAYAEFIVPDGEAFKKYLENNHSAYVTIFSGAEEAPAMKVTVNKGVTMNAAKLVDSANILFLLNNIPHGVIRFSPDVPDLTETSTSLSVAKMGENSIDIIILSRSANNDYLADCVKAIERLASVHNATIVTPTPDIGGWPALPNCHLLDSIKKVYKQLYHSDMAVTACHGGLENSIILNQYPSMNLESISIGPTCKDVHTPAETLEIESGNKLLDLICALTTELTH